MAKRSRGNESVPGVGVSAGKKYQGTPGSTSGGDTRKTVVVGERDKKKKAGEK